MHESGRRLLSLLIGGFNNEKFMRSGPRTRPQYAGFDFPVTAQYLILAGDIGRLTDYDAYLEFLNRQTERFERVFLVLGNHELYGLDFDTGLVTARKMERESCLGGRLSLLQQGRFDMEHMGIPITILGCTIWSQVPEDAKTVVESKMSDFRKIKDWSVESHNAAHKSDMEWLISELDRVRESNSDRSVIVISHHAPSVQETSAPQHAQNAWTAAFATDILSSGKCWTPVRCWIHGHTHYSGDFKKHGVRVASNQRGYVLPGAKFDVGRILEVRRIR
ncbi:Metallo-dependent phosphatase-like protein [Schizothecium vesticola]|uniref:Metallo-dependent phosphatase-like protein n=1 Tax=Schizothecium vesticola TaxID=314040 RepID=A0AA40ERL6_9PEZI|nr:Metallo-dependent phosphatase-like protein [Schizothecium vesticola]